ncbi:hypothetical protein CB1_001907019 [Camelus ferus]|nr:hypothetical protein CB1_001907019 [Camelus ferus]
MQTAPGTFGTALMTAGAAALLAGGAFAGATAEDSTDVGEEDSFLGQTSAHTSTPQTFSYFSQDVSNAFSPSIPKAQYGAPPSSQMGINTYLPSQPSSLPPSNFGSPPQGTPQQGYNPYRHTAVSSRANPYIAPPQLQQCQTPAHPTHPPPTGSPVQMYQMPPGSLPPVPPPVQPGLSPPIQQQAPAKPVGPPVQAPPPFLLQNQYEPVQPHWFYCKEVENKQLWMPFSVFDSLNLEEIYNSVQPDPESVVLGTDGGRYDVYLYDRMRKAVYWEEEPAEVRRCTWFYKGDTDSRFIPYTEDFSEKLEAEYKKAVTTNQWHRRLEFPSGETIVMHNPKVIVQFQPSSVPDEWGTTQDGQTRPRVVKRGIDDNLDEIPDGSLILFDILSNQKDLNLSKSPGPFAIANGVVKQPHFQEKQLMCTVDDLKEMGIPLGPRKKIANFVKHKAVKLEQKKAASEKKAVMTASTKGQEESAQKVTETASSPSESKESKRKLPLGAYVSSVHVDYESFEVGTGQVSVVYSSLDFEPEVFFALGSPIAMFLTIRGVDRIDENYRLPTCKGFFNIYHPLDPVAYRLEPMIVPDLDLKAVLIPHHKGRKRLHLELKESLSRMGSDLKQGFISSLKSAWQTLNEFARAHTSSTQLQEELEKVANQIKEEEEKQVVEAEKIVESPDFSKDEDYLGKVGMLNGGRRIDYVLQEKPIESFNEYLFALQSHLCYCVVLHKMAACHRLPPKAFGPCTLSS